jgi:hypothetical protein
LGKSVFAEASNDTQIEAKLVSLAVSHFGLADIRADAVELRRELNSFALLFRISGKAVVAEGDVWADIRGARLTVAGEGGHQHGFGLAIADQPVRIRRNGGAIFVEFRRSLAQADLEAIEGIRSGHSLTFGLSIFGDGATAGGSSERLPVQDTLSLTVARSDWIAMLNAVKARNILLVEIPVPLLDPPSDWLEIKRMIDRAQLLFLEAHYTESVLCCRKALEAAAKQLGWPENWAPQALDRGMRDRRAMTAAEREQFVLAAIHHFSNLSSHIGTYDRAQATFAIAETVAGVGRLVHGFEIPPI